MADDAGLEGEGQVGMRRLFLVGVLIAVSWEANAGFVSGTNLLFACEKSLDQPTDREISALTRTAATRV